MARSKAPKRPTPIEAIQHSDKRANIPTADAAGDFFDESASALPPLRYPRDPSLDPQLVWKGKDKQDGEDLIVDAPPIYIQEKVDPRAIIANVRSQSAGSSSTSPDEISLFNFTDFDELDELSQVEFYEHEESWKNRMILGDSLQVMGSLAEREALRGKVQMIYIDPPYGIKFGSNWQARAGKRGVKDGKLEDAAREAEQIKAFRDTWELGTSSYLSYLRDRLAVACDLLTDSGSVFVQIGEENVHLVRAVMDEVFGNSNFVSQISFRKTSAVGGKYLDGTNDFLLWYAKDRDSLKYRQLYVESPLTASAFPNFDGDNGAERVRVGHEGNANNRYRTDNLTSQSGGATTSFIFALDGVDYSPSRGAFWKTNESGMRRLRDAGRLVGNGRTLSFKRYYRDFDVRALNSWWDDTIQSTFAIENIYVVQTYTKVVQRCVLMTTDPGDLVLDPTCGSGTTAAVAEMWGRRWITVDTSRVALTLARQRLMGAKFPYFIKADSNEGRRIEGLPQTPTAGDIRLGFVYDKVQHITLKSIAQNPDIEEGMRRDTVVDAISKNADFEVSMTGPKKPRQRFVCQARSRSSHCRHTVH